MDWDGLTKAAGVYKAGNLKYVRVQSKGGWGHVGSITSQPIFVSTLSNRVPFFSSYLVNFVPQSLPTGWRLDQTAPANVNATGTMTVTTGWNVSANGGYGSAGLSAGYDQSIATTVTISDWSFSNTSGSPNAQWNYFMSGTYNCKDELKTFPESFDANRMISYCWSSARNFLHRPPAWSF